MVAAFCNPRLVEALFSSTYTAIVSEVAGHRCPRRHLYSSTQTSRILTRHRDDYPGDATIRAPGFRRYVATSNTDKNHVLQLFNVIAARVSDRDSRRSIIVPTSPSTMMERRTSAANLISEFCTSYLSLPELHPSLLEFLESLLDEKYGVNEESILATIDNVKTRSFRDTDIQRIRLLCTPHHESIFHYILGSAKQDLGAAFLVSLRRDISEVIRYWKFIQTNESQDNEEKAMTTRRLSRLQSVEGSMKSILSSLFRPGALQLQRITYDKTPASIIEQIAFKEAVHPLQSLNDLRQRLGPGRRCFAFFHPALPDKPLVFVHVALLKEMPSSMDEIQLASDDMEENATTATFYSITNSEQGLNGIHLGNHLIKSVVHVLQNEFPKLQTFCTLSPIPKFRSWLEAKLARYQQGLLREQYIDDGFLTRDEYVQLQETFPSDKPLLDLLETLMSPTWQSGNLADQLHPLLMKFSSYYLTIERHRGRPLCPVAKFHVGNGAEMNRLNYMADKSNKGMRRSCGMMINYRYDLNEIEENSTRYEMNGEIMVTDGVKFWLRGVK